MKIEKRDGAQERRVLIGMLVDPSVLGWVAGRWDRKAGLFRNDWSNLIGNWCVDYFNRYGEAPGQAIEGMFESWVDKANRDKDTVALIDRFLKSLSEEYEGLAEESNPQFVIDTAAEYFNKIGLLKLAEAINGDVDSGELEKAQQRVHAFGRVDSKTSGSVDVLLDQAAIREAFESKSEPLIRYPGALGNFFNDALERDAFVAFMGPEKRGKTWWLLDVAWRGLLQRRKVAFFEVGDMSQNQIMRRFMSRAARRPLRPGLVRYPKHLEHVPDSPYTIEFEERNFEKPLGWRSAWRACRDVLERKVKSEHSLLKLVCAPNSTLSVPGISSILQTWERQDWIPDVIVIDYADILAPISGYTESRDQINATWKALRALSQSTHCLVVTATQSDAESYGVEVLGRRNFSEDKRKLAHVTGMVGLNADESEKRDGVMRLNWVVLREGEFSETKCVYVAGCLHVANPAVLSTF